MSASRSQDVIAMPAVDASPAAVTTCARGFVTFPAAQTPGTLVAPEAPTRTQPVSGSCSQPSARRIPSFGRGLGATKTESHF
ncbi:hypothetical protein [Actinomadura sp. B10D3]|uniref:hypothetical protein n=1 Tax=Actinomadura sp. B10D3 TaxID=3153557 RepID=UPI00325F4101